MEDALKALLKEKEELVSTMREQMKKDVEAGILQPDTISCIERVQFNLAAAKQKMELGGPEDHEQALHLFGRLNWKLGEFIARVNYDRNNQEKQV